MNSESKGFFARHKRLILWCLAAYVVLTVALVLVSSGELLPFVYQVF